ncbi:MAG: hypothetical protein ABGY96_00575 [bacterium]|nr:hypothetical protein [Gammaproteobacteria bacterium]
MITKGDDYPLHQTPDPMAYTGANRNFYDRFFFNGYDRRGEIFFAAALGVYPYLNVMDAAFSVVIEGVQHNVYGSKVMHMERMDTEVGHVKIEIVEPLSVLRVVCEDEANGIRADVTFTARTPAHEEPRFMRRSGSQVMMDVTRMTQNGTWAGWVEVKGRRINVKADNFRGTRDRSWGIRSVGQADPQTNPDAMIPQFYWLWAPLNFDEFATHYFVNDDQDGIPWNGNGVVIPLLDSENETVEKMQSWSSKIQFESGRRTAKSTEIDFVTSAGEQWNLKLTTQWNFYMKGIGYGHEHFGHGSYHGELETGYDEFILAEVDATNLHVQAMCDVVLTTPNKTHQGQGILEQLIFGPHAPSGFTELMDMAP